MVAGKSLSHLQPITLANGVTATCDDPNRTRLPAFHSRRVLLVMTKMAFRGHNGLERLLAYASRPVASHTHPGMFGCTDEAIAIQAATSRAHEQLVIRSLETAGFSVDVILSAHLNCSSNDTAKLGSLLHSWYGPGRIVSTNFYGSSEAPQQNYATLRAVRQVQLHLAASSTKPYHSLLFWRFDVVPTRPLALSSVPRGATPLTRPAIRALLSANRNVHSHWAREFIGLFAGE